MVEKRDCYEPVLHEKGGCVKSKIYSLRITDPNKSCRAKYNSTSKKDLALESGAFQNVAPPIRRIEYE
jgi:hypothetical protein